MAQIQIIKRRIRSASNMHQITKAMELVAASKMRRAQEAAVRAKAYNAAAAEILVRLGQLADVAKQPLFAVRPVKSQLLVFITSDRGLAGAYNSNVIRLFLERLREAEQAEITTKVIVVGNQGARLVSRLETIELIGSYSNWPTQLGVGDIRPISQTATELFVAGEIDRVEIIGTKFFNAIRQEAHSYQLLPIVPTTVAHEEDVAEIADEAVFEPSADAVLDKMVPRLVESQLFQAGLEAIASEESMRMMAMKNASDNASDIIDDLTLIYNGARQAAITQELAEITGGAEAIA